MYEDGKIMKKKYTSGGVMDDDEVTKSDENTDQQTWHRGKLCEGCGDGLGYCDECSRLYARWACGVGA